MIVEHIKPVVVAEVFIEDFSKDAPLFGGLRGMRVMSFWGNLSGLRRRTIVVHSFFSCILLNCLCLRDNVSALDFARHIMEINDFGKDKDETADTERHGKRQEMDAKNRNAVPDSDAD